MLPRTGSEQGAGTTALVSSASQRLTKLLAVYFNERIMQTLSKIGIRVLCRKYLFCQFIERKILEETEKNKTNQNK